MACRRNPAATGRAVDITAQVERGQILGGLISEDYGAG
jgi:hypothetical protein